MTGPPYPRPVSGSNSVGQFQVGISSIGTIPPFDWWSTVLPEYANSPILTGIIGAFFSAADMTENFDNFFDIVFNLQTAFGAGLDVWGRRLGVSRILNVGSGSYIGFEEAQPGPEPWGQGTWYGGQGITTNYALADGPFRLLLLAKAAFNISGGCIPSINAILMSLFLGRGNAYVVDGLNMTMQYFFTFPLSPVELSIVGQSGVLPRPAGVSATVIVP